MAEWRRPKRQRSYEIHWRGPLKTMTQVAFFIDYSGFCVLFSAKNVPLTSLYYAVSKRADPRWDKYAQLIWKWKDELPNKRRTFYAKYFKGRGTFLSVKLLPHFLSTHGTAAEPHEAEAFYKTGRISYDARELWRALEKHGALATLELRHAC